MEVCSRRGTVEEIRLLTRAEDRETVEPSLMRLGERAGELGLRFRVYVFPGAYDRRAHFSRPGGTWCITSGFGLNMYRRPADAVEWCSSELCETKTTWIPANHTAGRK